MNQSGQFADQTSMNFPQTAQVAGTNNIGLGSGITEGPSLGQGYSGSTLGTEYNGLGSEIPTDTSGQLGGGYSGQTLGSGQTTGMPGDLDSPFMKGINSIGKFIKENPYKSAMGAYMGLNALGAFKPSSQTFNQPEVNPMGLKKLSADFKGTHPDPTQYQYTPRYAEGGMAMGGQPNQMYPMSQQEHTNFMEPSQMPTSAMAVRDFEPATNPMTGTPTQPMRKGGVARFDGGGVTGGGQMHLDVPINIGGGGGGGGSGGFGFLNNAVGLGGSAVDGFNTQQQQQSQIANLGAGYTPPGGSGLQAGDTLMSDTFSGGKNPQAKTMFGSLFGNPAPNNYSAQMGFPSYSGPQSQSQQAQGMASGGITDVPRFKGGTDVYEASQRFADMYDPQSKYSTPPEKSDVGIFRDESPTTRYLQATPAAQARLNAINKRAYINGLQYKTPASMSQLGGLNFTRPGEKPDSTVDNTESILAASGGIMGYNLGGYAQGDMPRLLRGPGDGVSDNIPATIAGRQPARLADGEFVIPARIVSELGNGSTEAGAKRLHKMMDDVQKARGKTVGKDKVAVDSKAYKKIPKA